MSGSPGKPNKPLPPKYERLRRNLFPIGTMVRRHFEKIGYDHDDDYISNEHGKIGYLIMEEVNYIVFREENNVGVFTHSVINYIRTLTEFDTVTVKEDEDDADFIFIGNASEFITFWDEMGDGEE